MDNELKPVYSAANVQDAHLLKNLLEQQGIQAMVSNEALQGAAGELPLGWASAPRVMVLEQDAERARQFVAEFEQSSRPADSLDDARSDDAAGVDWLDWPVCPQCGRRRQAVCTSCEVAGTDFPLAEFVAPTAPVQRPWRTGDGGPAPVDSQGQPILLMCPNCDEAFPPRFYRHCEQCGHDFGSGVQPEAFTRESFNARAAVVICGIILLGIGFLLYFAVLLSGD